MASPCRLLVTPGEPAGVGPEILAQAAIREWPFELAAVADPQLLQRGAARCGLSLQLEPLDAATPPAAHRPGHLKVLARTLNEREKPGHPQPRHAGYVLACLRDAARLCEQGHAAAMVTGPVHKAAINRAGHAFSGHTGYLAHQLGAPRTVMLLGDERLKVALATTHVPLAQVASTLDRHELLATISILHEGLRNGFALARPRILVLGLNPHAGEGGYLGREEIEILAPALREARRYGIAVSDPVPADTAFAPATRRGYDAILAMYHDQGLAPLKALRFGAIANITLGLPIVRTSVDHGTALDLAGTGRAGPGSLETALRMAAQIAANRQPQAA